MDKLRVSKGVVNLCWCDAGQPSDDEQAHDCLRYHAVEGDSALLNQAPTKPFPCPAMAHGPALANSPALDLASTYVPGPVNSRKRSKAAASAGRGKPGTGEQQPVTNACLNHARDWDISIDALFPQSGNAMWSAFWVLLVSIHVHMANGHTQCKAIELLYRLIQIEYCCTHCVSP